MSSELNLNKSVSVSDALALSTAQAILDADAFLVSVNNPFRLTSGLLAPFYINCRQILSNPSARASIGDGLSDAIRSLGAETIAGGVTAGVPYATMVAERLKLPLVYVRPEPKDYGTGGQIEGGNIEGQHVVLVEDLITTATSVMNFSSVLRSANAKVNHVVVVFSRVTESATSKLIGANIKLTSLCELECLLTVSYNSGRINEAELSAVRSFLDDPEKWSENNKS